MTFKDDLPETLVYEKTLGFRAFWFHWPLRPLLLLVALSVMVVAMSGCIKRSINGPRVPTVFKVNKGSDTRVLTEVQNFRDGKCLDNSDKACEPSVAERDTIIYDLKLIIDRNYEDYALAFERLQDTSIFSGEITSASLTAVATLVGATATKDILTTASTLVQSTSVSAQKNFYQKQTSYTILNVMDSQRAKQWAAIYARLAQDDIKKYPLSEALSDLAEYRKAGTGLQALASIQETAGQVKANAGTDVHDTNVATGRLPKKPPPNQPPQNPPQNPQNQPQDPPQNP